MKGCKIRTRRPMNFFLLNLLLLSHSISAEFVSIGEYYTYTNDGQVETYDGPRTDVIDITTYRYHETTFNLKEIENALGHINRYNNYNIFGRAELLEDENGVQSILSYTAQGWLKSFTIKHPADSSKDTTTTYNYDAIGQLTCITTPNGIHTKYIYDETRRLKNIVEGAASCEEESTNRNYLEYIRDDAGNITDEIVYHDQDGDAQTNSIQSYHLKRTYDEFNRLLEIQEADIDGDANLEITRFIYDPNSYLTKTFNPQQEVHTQYPDALGRIDYETNAKYATVDYQYDAAGRLSRVIDPEQANNGTYTEFHYNFADMLTEVSSPETGTTIYNPDEAGNIVQISTPNGTTNYTYDEINRLTAVTFQNAPQENINYIWDDESSGSFHKGKLSRIQYEHGEITYDYDHRGNIINRKDIIDGHSFSVEYGYNSDDQLEAISLPHNLQIHYIYNNNDGKLSDIEATFDGSTQSLASNIKYLPFGPIASYKFGNQLERTLIYDTNYRLLGISTPGIQDVTYGFYADSTVEQIIDNLVPGASQFFNYDAVDYLKYASGAYGVLTYDYDEVGNRISKIANGTTDSYLYQPGTQLLDEIIAEQNIDIGVDSVGNIISKNSDSYAYNQQNRMISATVNGSTTNYGYNPLGQRVFKKNANTTLYFVYDLAGNLLLEADIDGGVKVAYVYMDGQRLAIHKLSIDYQGYWYYIHNDHLNTPRVLTDQGQNVVWAANYTPFGLAITTTDVIENNLRFPGQYFDEETGFHYNYNRTYDPSLGRYLQSDPIGLEGGINTYGYVYQNPLIYTDPYGLDVYLCKQPAFGIPNNPIDHHWLKTDKHQSGMGPVKSDCGNAGNQSGDYPGDPVQTCDHSERDMEGATCEKLNNIDENIVDERIAPGQPLGRWSPWNQCQSFARDVINDARTGCRQTRRGVRCPSVF